MQEQNDIDKGAKDEPAADIAAVTPPTPKEYVKKNRSFGNKMFDWVIWPAVQWVGVWGLSLLIANRAQSGSGLLNKWFNQLEGWLKPRLTSLDSPAAQKIWGKDTSSQQWAKGTALFTALWMGGNASLPIIKYFEDRRQRISSWFDRKFNKVAKDENTIKEEPKQTWASVTKGRLSVSLLNYATFIGLGPGRSQKVQDAIGNKATDAYMKLRPHADRERVSTLANLAVFDLLFTALGAAVHYSTSRLFARHDATHKHNIIAGDSVIVPEPAEAEAEQQEKPKAREELKGKKPEQKQKEGWIAGEEAKKQAEAVNVNLRP